ncbi:MAG: hypothetical protein JWP12_1847 [Bacteroidetes bacterium]|nr:hypothetical protein [Bacteroidota bacterium]
MPIEPRDQLKTYFETGDIPTQDQFDAVLDSYVHKTDDGITIYDLPSSTEKYFGINTLVPEAPLGITAMGDDDTIASFNKSGDTTATWFLNLNGEEGTGFNIDQALVSGHTSRLFISETSGAVGLGTTTPTQKLQIEASSGNNVTALKIVNTATVANDGFGVGHEHSSGDPGINGSLVIFENEFSQSTKRMVFRPGGNVGINILTPDTKLHVGGDLNSPPIDLDLIEGTGLVTIGPMESNVIYDYRGLQAREGNYVGTVLNLTASTLNLQRLGGDVLFYGDDSFDDTDRTILTEGSYLGIGVIDPVQRIDVDGAIRIQSTDKEYDGSIRYTGDDFEGFMDGTWHSFTSGGDGGGQWTQVGSIIYYKKDIKTFVGIGTSEPETTLDVEDGEHATGSNTAVLIYNHAVTTGKNNTDKRIGLEIKNTGDWGNPKGRDIGLYISDVSGSTITVNGNIAAIMNGNVVVGDLDEVKPFLGSGAKNVLAIRNGGEPFAAGGVTSVQLYSQNYGITGDCTLHILNGNGDLMRLYKEDGLTEADEHDISIDTYGAIEAAVIENLRTRINQLEQRLMRFGLIGDPVPAP